VTFEEFRNTYRSGHPDPRWRMGQRLFNRLLAVRPDLSEAIRGVGGLDPFHRDDLIPDCLAWLEENW